MGELLYLYLEENNMLDLIANSLVVERRVELLKKEKNNEKAYFEGSLYFDKNEFREYVDCYKYTYVVNTTFNLNGKNVFSHLDIRNGISIDKERPHGVFGSKNANCLYHNAEGVEQGVYQNTMDKIPNYVLKHVSCNGNSKEKIFKLPTTLRGLLENENDFAKVLCNILNINLNNYSNELVRRKEIFEKISMIDKQIIQLEKLKNDYLNQLSYGKSK